MKNHTTAEPKPRKDYDQARAERAIVRRISRRLTMRVSGMQLDGVITAMNALEDAEQAFNAAIEEAVEPLLK